MRKGHLAIFLSVALGLILVFSIHLIGYSHEDIEQIATTQMEIKTVEVSDKEKRVKVKAAKPKTSNAKSVYSPEQFKVLGEIYHGEWRYTWYSQRVLPGGGLRIPGRHVDKDGYICDGAERVTLASVDLPEGTIVHIPFGSGTGIVRDSGCPSGTLDVYVDW